MVIILDDLNEKEMNDLRVQLCINDLDIATYLFS